MTILDLTIGSKLTGVSIVQDGEWPIMWRIKTADGRLSDIANLTRAKDAAVAFASPKGIGGASAMGMPTTRRCSNVVSPPETAPLWLMSPTITGSSS